MDRDSYHNLDLATGIVYLGNRDPYHYLSDIEEILTHHCRFVIHPISETDLESYKKSLTEIFEITKQVGLNVIVQPHAFGNVFDGLAPGKFVLQHAESLQVLSNFQAVPAACMNNTEFRAFLRQWVDEVVELGVDGIVWENPHYYNFKDEKKLLQWGCWCHTCKQLYLQKFQHRLPKGIGEDINLLNEYTIVNFITELCDYAKARQIKNIVCLSPMVGRNLSMSGWKQVAEIPSVDIIAAKPYWYYSQFKAEAFITGIAKRISDLGDNNGKIGQIWIQNFKLLAEEESQVAKAIEICIEQGIKSLVGWSYYGSRVVSAMRCQNPRVVWDTLGAMFNRFLLHWDSIK